MRPVSLIAFGALAVAACQPGPRPITEADRAAIRAVDSTIVAALSKGDVATATAGYTADGVVMPPGMPAARNADGIRQLWTGMTGLVNMNLTSRSERIEGEGDLAYNIATYHVTGTMKDGTNAAIPPDDGKLLQVFRRQSDGSWKAAAEVWNSNTPPAAPAPTKAAPTKAAQAKAPAKAPAKRR